MSGTSLDGVDGVLVDFSGVSLEVVARASLPFATPFRTVAADMQHRMAMLRVPGAPDVKLASVK